MKTPRRFNPPIRPDDAPAPIRGGLLPMMNDRGETVEWSRRWARYSKVSTVSVEETIIEEVRIRTKGRDA